MWFDGNAQEAVDFYVSVFKEAKILNTFHYPTDESMLLDFQKDLAGQPLSIEFLLFGQKFVAINAGPEFTFNEAVSFLVECEDQEEIDYYWENLTKNGGTESVCGWCKDKYGLSWQVCPKGMDKLIKNPQAYMNMMNMKKINIANLI